MVQASGRCSPTTREPATADPARGRDHVAELVRAGRPDQPTLDVERRGLRARRRLHLPGPRGAPAHEPNNGRTTDSRPATSSRSQPAGCDGTTHTSAFDGVLAGTIDDRPAEGPLPARTPATSTAPSRGAGPAGLQRPPEHRAVRVRRQGRRPRATRGGRRADRPGPAQHLPAPRPGHAARLPEGDRSAGRSPDDPTGDGESSPALADLDGDNRNELIFGGSDGFVHALRPRRHRAAGLAGPRRPRRRSHTGGRAFTSGEVSSEPRRRDPRLGRGRRLDHDGIPEVVAADIEGKVYGWSADGQLVFSARPTSPSPASRCARS